MSRLTDVFMEYKMQVTDAKSILSQLLPDGLASLFV